MRPRHKSITLLELLIAIALLSVIVIGFSSIDLFSRYHVLTSDRRAKVQNEVSYVLEHMTKEISRAIGDVNQPPITLFDFNQRIVVFIDFSGNGRRDNVPPDRRIAYWYRPNTTPVAQRFRIFFCQQCANATCDVCTTPWFTAATLLSGRNIFAFTPNYNPNNNFIDIVLTARWDPAQAVSSDNPEVVMRTKIKMPSVSTH